MVTIFSIHDKFCVSYSSKFLFRVCVQKVADFAVLEGAAVAVQADKVATPPERRNASNDFGQCIAGRYS
ncbi:hypothetical protein HOLleu_27531 [Holothuria leucospilota]|uniref:Uncharacterized protein n=1 Tax=Holothuria leucospilota TaxID=206669 RepID=A0A9Q1BQW7_HOLLE|nr:hypothetical protein HOLleu_27531 [Holothuria leucospilota]